MGATLAKVPNSRFVSYLGSYGLGSNLQFDEHVAKAAVKYQMEPFTFDLPQQNAYREAIQHAIDNQHSTLILLCGRAGDGKTYFLRHIFTDLIGGTIDLWNTSPNFFSWQRGNITFTLVKDFTANDSAAEQKKLRATIEAIFKQNRQSAAAGLDVTAIQEQSYSPCHIVIIAGNNGKILERFQSFFGAQRAEVQSFIGALESYMLQHDRSALDQLPGVQCHDMSACLGTAEVANIYVEVLGDKRWQSCEQCGYHDLCPIVRNRKVLQDPLVLTRFLQIHELLVDDGLHFTMRNVLLLIVNALLGRDCDDKYLTCQVVSSNYARVTEQIKALPLSESYDHQQEQINHILMRSKLGSKPFDNLFGCNFTKSLSKRGRKKSVCSSPVSALSADTMPIFSALDTLGIGSFSTKLSDEFLVLGANSEIFDQSITQFYHELKRTHDHYDLLSTLEQCYEQVQKDSGDDDKSSAEAEIKALKQMQELFMSLRRLLFFVLSDPASDHLFAAEITAAQQACLTHHGNQGLTHSKALSVASTNAKPFFNPFLLTAYPFALSYLTLKRDALAAAEAAAPSAYGAATTGFNLRRYPASFDCAKQLIVGLNRAFTSLMLLDSTDNKVLITTNNKLNPLAPSVIYDDRYEVQVDYEGRGRANTLCLALRGQRLALVFYANARARGQLAYREEAQSTKLCYLDLSPKLWTYLMSLAEGTAGLSFAQENSKDLAAFKASIDAAIRDDIVSSHEGDAPSLEQLFYSIQVCEVNKDGSLRRS